MSNKEEKRKEKRDSNRGFTLIKRGARKEVCAQDNMRSSESFNANVTLQKVHIRNNQTKSSTNIKKGTLKEMELDTTVNAIDIRNRTGPHLDVGFRNEEGSSMYRKAENFGSATVASNTCNTVFRLRAATWV